MAFKMKYQAGARQMTAPLYQKQTNVSTGESIVKYDSKGNRIVSTPTTTTTTTPGYTIPAVEAPKPTEPDKMPPAEWTQWKKDNPEEYQRRLEQKKNQPTPPNPPNPPNPVPSGGVTPGGSTPGSSGGGSPAVVVPDKVESNTTWASVSEAPPVNYSTGENTQVVNTSKIKKGFKPFKWTQDLNIRFPKIRIGKLGIGNALFGARGVLNPRTWANCKGGGCMRNPR